MHHVISALVSVAQGGVVFVLDGESHTDFDFKHVPLIGWLWWSCANTNSAVFYKQVKVVFLKILNHLYC